MQQVVRSAGMEDIPSLIAFLEYAGLGTGGVADSIDYFLIMEDEIGQIMATIGIEPYGQTGLLRSLVLTSGATEKEFFLLFEQIMLLAKDKGLMDIFSATNKEGARMLVEQLGFQQRSKEELPQILFQSEHLQHILTVDNSVFLKLSI